MIYFKLSASVDLQIWDVVKVPFIGGGVIRRTRSFWVFSYAGVLGLIVLEYTATHILQAVM